MTTADPTRRDTPHLSLADAVPQGTDAQWRRLVEGILKGKPFETLVSTTADAIVIQPLYPRYRGGMRPGLAIHGGWNIAARIDHRDGAAANAAARIALENGATALDLVFASGTAAYGFGISSHDAVALDALFQDIQLDAAVPVTIDAGAAAQPVAATIVEGVVRRGLQPEATEFRFGIDPLGTALVRGFSPEPWSSGAERFAAGLIALSARGFRGSLCAADGRAIHNAGGSEAQELAYVLGCALAYLRALEAAGMPLDTARQLVSFRLSADADQFVTMAKFRALRLLWTQVEAGCGLEHRPIALHAETAWRMMSRRDCWSNVLRTTLGLIAAGLGGADTVTVLPHTQVVGLPDDFARRLARNAQLVVLHEANLDKVADPAAGSGGLEALTDALAEKAWALLQAMESRGGLAEDMSHGTLQADVLRVRSAREADVATRRVPILGTSIFPLIEEPDVEVLEGAPVPGPASPLPDDAATLIPLPPIRWAEMFERLRYYADLYATRTGRRPRVFLANMGTRDAFFSRAGFAEALFGTGGFEATSKDDAFDTDEMLLKAFQTSKASIACLCGHDRDYAERALSLVTALRDHGATGVFIAGRPGEGETRLRQAGATRYVFEGGDAVDALQAAHDAL